MSKIKTNLSNLKKRFDLRFIRQPLLSAWLLFFVFAAVVALSLQWVVLPFLLPEIHAGNGLLAGGDWVGFHKIAMELAEKIHVQGWSAWELRPYGHSPAGIAAAIYALTVSEPYVLIPLYAALHATAGVALMRIFQFLTDDDFAAMCAALPFVLFPSAMAWYAQIGKDGFYFAGAFLCLYGWILLARLPTWQSGWRQVAAGLAWLGIGIALMGLVRTYSFQVMQGMGFIFAMGLSVLFIVRGAKGQLRWKTCAAAIAILLLIPLLLRFAPIETRGSAELPRPDAPLAANHWHGDTFAREVWRPSGWLPRLVENNFLKIAVLREGYLSTPGYLKAGSMIDRDVRMSSATDLIAYLPRAAQIGFLAPFPSHWIAPGHSPGGSLMRWVAGAEMIVVYCALLFLPYAVWHWRRKVEMWLPVVFGTVLVLTYAISTPNIGSLYRLRYGFLMLLVALGIMGGIAAWQRISRYNSSV